MLIEIVYWLEIMEKRILKKNLKNNFGLSTTWRITDCHEETITRWDYFIHNLGFGIAYPTVHDSNENQNVDSSQSRWKKTNLVSETTIRKTIIEICVK